MIDAPDSEPKATARRMWASYRWSNPARVIITVALVVWTLFIAVVSTAFFLPPQVTIGGVAQRTQPSGGIERTEGAIPDSAVVEPGVKLVEATVVRVVDGDTAVFDLKDGERERVRFIGVDTPESTTSIEAYGKQASRYTERVLKEGRIVYLERDVEKRDKYGRLLAYVWLARPSSTSGTEIRAKMFNAHLAIDGYAQQMTIQPNSKYATFFTTYVAEARDAQRGLWNPKRASTAGLGENETLAPVPPVSPNAVVYLTESGTHFHADGCEYLAHSKIKSTVAEALAKGYAPCQTCNPPQ